MSLVKYRIEAIKAAKLHLEQSQWPDHDISVAFKVKSDERGPAELIITRSLKAASERGLDATSAPKG